jgi:L-arabinokinase
MPHVVFYISGHGYGHAVRMSEVIRALAALAPECTVAVRCGASGDALRHIFAGIAQVEPARLDSGVVEENGALSIDAPATVRRLSQLLRDRQQIIAREVDLLRQQRPALLVADIPYLAGDIAAAAGVPCIGIANFTWDWIYEPYLAAHPERQQLLDIIRGGYGRMQSLLRLPLSHVMSGFQRVVDMPLVARHPRQGADDVHRRLGLDPRDSRTRVLLAMREGISPAALETAARQGPEFLFLDPNPVTAGLPNNVRHVELRPELRFTELLAACRIVISKLGYGILSECIASQVAMLYPPRVGFREEELLRVAVGRYVPGREIPLGDYQAGDWLGPLRSLRDTTAPCEALDTHGGAACARIIADACGQKS